MIRKIKNKLKSILPEKKIPILIQVERNSLLRDRVAFITGGTTGIGLEITKAYLNSGACVIIASRNLKRLKDTVNIFEKEYPGKIFYFQLDISNVKSFKGIFDSIEKNTGKKCDILVNNSGIMSETVFPNISEDDFDGIINTNLKGTLFLSQEFSNYMIKNNIGGNILNIGSSSGLRPANSPYMISKWGIRAITAGMAKTLIKYNIVVNGIAPGPVATEMLNIDKSNLNGTKNDAKRYAAPEEISNYAVHLVSNESRLIIGEMVNINGGSGTLNFDDINY